MNIGFTIGKFSPFHKGHQYLIETGIGEMDKMIVIVYDTELSKVSTEKRAGWIKTLYPTVDVRIAHNPPTQYGLDDESVKIQMEYLCKIIKDDAVTHFYSSEPYGEKVAEYLGIVNRQVDPERKKYPISASNLRFDLRGAQRWLEDDIYEDLLKY